MICSRTFFHKFWQRNELSSPVMRKITTETFADQNVHHDTQSHEFYYDVDGKGRAVLTYDLKNSTTIRLLHTEVPVTLKGSGLGKIIAKKALAYVAEHNLAVEVECDFVRYYVEKIEPKYLQYMKK